MSEDTAVTITKHVPVKIDSYRKQALSDIVVDEEIEEQRLTAHLKQVNDSIKALIKTCQKKRSDAAHAHKQGFELTPVSCEHRVDMGRKKMLTIRTDTWEEIEERNLTADEIQYYNKKTATIKPSPE